VSEYITLMGAEDVRRGGNMAQEGGESMIRAANTIDESLRRFQSFMEDWLIELKDTIDAIGDKK